MYRQQDASAGAGQHHFLSASTPSSSFSQTTFPSPLFNLDPSLQASPQLLQPSAHHGIPAQQLPDRPPSSGPVGSMQPPRSVSPRVARSTPGKASPRLTRIQDRTLPLRNVTADTITDTYVAFILYCNPHFPLDVDTKTLRTNFNNPPKSDNKDFETYRLFELIQLFDAKEIKTWGHLALELGVEPPDVSKNQSTQKVQQYSVRLKRWMRAMHIDAFFEYLLGKQHAYFTDLPPANDPYPATGRDNVQAEEDLAIRALEPSFRPKRGRRRNSETEQDAEGEVEPMRKQPRLESANDYHGTMSAYPASAHPDAYNDPWAMASAVTSQTFTPWAGKQAIPHTAVAATAPSHLRWQLHGVGSQHAASPQPMTAQPTSMAALIEAAFDASETKTPVRRRRKHGPAVSSAWSSGNPSGAKPRGRPPANRNMQDGPFNTFPADPSNDRASVPMQTPMSNPVQVVGAQESLPMAPPLVRKQSDGPGRLAKLSLQVPQHTGGPVRLATPPAPRVLVNGEANDSDGRSTSQTPIGELPPRMLMQQPQTQRVAANMQVTNREIPGFAFEALKRALTSDLLRAELSGRQHRLSGDEAKRLADSVLQRMGVPRQDTEDPRDDIARLTAASWLGLGEQFNVPLGPAISAGKRINFTRFRTDAEGYPEMVSAHEEVRSADREIFDLSWIVSMAGCNGTFQLKDLALADPVVGPDDPHDAILKRCQAEVRQVSNLGEEAARQIANGMLEVRQAYGNANGNGNDDGVDWKAKCMGMEFASRIAFGELKRVKNRIMDQMLDVLLE